MAWTEVVNFLRDDVDAGNANYSEAGMGRSFVTRGVGVDLGWVRGIMFRLFERELYRLVGYVCFLFCHDAEGIRRDERRACGGCHWILPLLMSARDCA